MSDYPYTPLYYRTPVRVRYFNSETLDFELGICYRDELITRDGEIQQIERVINEAMSHGLHFDAAIVECTWRKLT